MAYALLTERLERRLIAIYEAALIRGLEPPNIAESIAEFDQALLAEPTRVDRNQRAVLAAIGVGR